MNKRNTKINGDFSLSHVQNFLGRTFKFGYNRMENVIFFYHIRDDFKMLLVKGSKGQL